MKRIVCITLPEIMPQPTANSSSFSFWRHILELTIISSVLINAHQLPSIIVIVIVMFLYRFFKRDLSETLPTLKGKDQDRKQKQFLVNATYDMLTFIILSVILSVYLSVYSDSLSVSVCLSVSECVFIRLFLQNNRHKAWS